MAIYEIFCTSFLGMSHCGCVTAEGEGKVELTDEEVASLVNLIKEKGCSDVEGLGLEDALPEVYEKLDDACREAAFEGERDHWLWEGYSNGYYEYDTYGLMDYCESECGFSFEYDEEEYLDEDGELDEDVLDEAKLEAFEEWLDDYISGLDKEERNRFLVEQMNAEVDMDGVECDYEVVIPQAIIEIAAQ